MVHPSRGRKTFTASAAFIISKTSKGKLEERSLPFSPVSENEEKSLGKGVALDLQKGGELRVA